jgi:hypothetical protein
LGYTPVDVTGRWFAAVESDKMLRFDYVSTEKPKKSAPVASDKKVMRCYCYCAVADYYCPIAILSLSYRYYRLYLHYHNDNHHHHHHYIILKVEEMIAKLSLENIKVMWDDMEAKKKRHEEVLFAPFVDFLIYFFITDCVLFIAMHNTSDSAECH